MGIGRLIARFRQMPSVSLHERIWASFPCGYFCVPDAALGFALRRLIYLLRRTAIPGDSLLPATSQAAEFINSQEAQ